MLRVTATAAERAGPLVLVQGMTAADLLSGADHYDSNFLRKEVSTSVNSAAAAGNASLMTLAER